MRYFLLGLLVTIALSVSDVSVRAQSVPAPEKLYASFGVSGGLSVMVGCRDGQAPIELARTGRFLVHVLEGDQVTVDAVRKSLRDADLYGLASAEQIGRDGRLPYTENLANVIVFGDRASVPIAEAARVLRPGGVLLTSRPADFAAAGLAEIHVVGTSAWHMASKPWPANVDAWSHPRHGADGNAVSTDEVSVPRRIRWVAGPQQEISNFVTAGGRAFFGGAYARDAFNGLRLWEEKLTPSPARGGFGQTVGSTVLPIATPDLLLVWSDNKLQALDSATGTLVRTYPDAGVPTEILVAGNSVLSINRDAIHVLDVQTAKLVWKQAAPSVRCAVAADGRVYYVHGDPKKPQENMLSCRDLATGAIRWQQAALDWLPKVRRLTAHKGLLACEDSTLTDEKAGNVLQMVDAADGKSLWAREYIPGAAHKQQARAMFIGDLVWVLEAKHVVGMDPRSGEVKRTMAAPNVHCFPPVATNRYLFSGEMDLTDLVTGKILASQITKQACSRDAGVVPANGLIYTFPKHCICWPMLRDYAALAGGHPVATPDWDKLKFSPEPGDARAPDRVRPEDPASQWPAYRHDAQRSGSTPDTIPAQPRVLWTATIGERPVGPIAQDWRDNFYIRSPVGPPVVAHGMIYVTRPDAHQVIAMDARTGQPCWTFTATGRVDTAPTIHRGLCLFGCKSGWVYCLRADDGGLVWRLRAAPTDERIIAYGQLESPWPVPGSVLVADNVAYFAAGRHPLADGGVFVFAVNPATGKVRWQKRLHTVPQKNFYGSSGLEFDNFDLLQVEGRSVAMSRWLFDRATGDMTLKARSGFAQVDTGKSSVFVPRGTWSYAPRNESEQSRERPFVRPLVVFRDNTVFSCSQDRHNVFRRDFEPDGSERFDTEWFAGWKTYAGAKTGGDLWQSQRLARGAVWAVNPFDVSAGKQPIAAMVLAGKSLCMVSAPGRLAIANSDTGGILGETQVPPPAWDSLAVAEGRLFLTTQEGRVVCLGDAR
ncbi:MAG: PQQ-binding-like beta-propeller repeat protein [Tepidisphaeraceae bacterium]